MPTVLRALLLAVVFTALPVGIGVAMTGDSAPAAPPAYTSTGLGDFDTSTVAVTRGAFCDRLPGAAVTAALGKATTSADAYADGDRRPVQKGAKSDVLHEYGCRFTAGGAEARAWVFTPPVTVAQAKAMSKSGDKGCALVKDAPAFGNPSVATLCGVGTRTASFHGLFGDAWLSCSLAVPKGRLADPALVDRTGRWCVAVARAATATTN